MHKMLSKKVYPNAVRTRPLLLKLAMIGIVGVVIIFIAVLVSSLTRKRQGDNFSTESAQLLASHSDTEWYQNLTPQPATPAPPPPPEIAVADEKPTTTTPTFSAPNFSNKQLIGEEFYRGNAPPFKTENLLQPLVSASSPKTAFLNAKADQNEDRLQATLQNAQPFTVQAGNILPALLLTGINSDLPGQIIGQIKTSVYDSTTGKYLLIPQGSRLIGLYDAQIVHGQERVLVVWKRILFPNGKSINLEGMPGIDLSGYAGFNDQVNNHYSKIFGSVILMSILSSGAQLAQPQQPSDYNQPPNINQMLAQNLGTHIADVGTALLNKNINIPPTLQIRPGYEFNITVTKDIVFPGPYNN